MLLLLSAPPKVPRRPSGELSESSESEPASDCAAGEGRRGGGGLAETAALRD